MHIKSYNEQKSDLSFYRVLTVFMSLTIAILVYSINAMEQTCVGLENDKSLLEAKNATYIKLEKQVAMGLCLPILEERR